MAFLLVYTMKNIPRPTLSGHPLQRGNFIRVQNTPFEGGCPDWHSRRAGDVIGISTLRNNI